MHVTIIGGGLVGLGTAHELLRRQPDLNIHLVEKEARFGQHQSTHNSGVLHAGLYYKPGSIKAQLAVTGIRRMRAFCEQHEIPHEICGKLVLATDAVEVERLRTLLERGRQNGLKGLRWLDRDAIREIEPHAEGLAAVHVPEEGIVDYARVCEVLARELVRQGARLQAQTKVTAARRKAGGWRIETTQGDFFSDYVINCAGLHCDRVARLFGEKPTARIVPFRGEYYQLREKAQSLVRHLIYPVPDPKFPFLGVHFTRLVGGGVEAGPNAVLALAREGYSKWSFRPRDCWEALTYSGLWRFMGQHRRMAWDEVRRSLSRTLFCDSLRRLVPDLQETDLEPGGSGVRAQAMLADGTLVQDFHLLERPHALHVLNAPSPAATASLAIGAEIAKKYFAQRASISSGTSAVVTEAALTNS